MQAFHSQNYSTRNLAMKLALLSKQTRGTRCVLGFSRTYFSSAEPCCGERQTNIQTDLVLAEDTSVLVLVTLFYICSCHVSELLLD